jgi:serine/threonine protein kinase
VLVNAKQETRLIDFSLAQTKMDRFLQFSRRIEGTPLYMAPEQIRGEKCDPRGRRLLVRRDDVRDPDAPARRSSARRTRRSRTST